MSDISSTTPVIEGGGASIGDGSPALEAPTTEVEAPSTQVEGGEGLGELPTESGEQPTSEQVEALFEVDGTPITLDEARNGYLRTADYTRKTQELAQQRSQIQDAAAIQAALERDPQRTLEALAQVYLGTPMGIPPQQAPQQAPVAPPVVDDDPWADEPSVPQPTVDPAIQRELEGLKQWRQQEELKAAQAQLDQEAAQLHATYGDFDDRELYTHALKYGHTTLGAAYKDLHFDRLMAEQKQAQAEQERMQAKRTAQTVHSGPSVKVPAGGEQTQSFGSAREAIAAAFKQHRLS